MQGYAAISTPAPTNEAAFHIPTLDCPEEFISIEKGLRQLDGIRQVRPDYFKGALYVEYDTSRLDEEKIAQRLRQIGFPAGSGLDRPAGADETPARLRASAIAGGGVLAVAATIHLALDAPWTTAALAVISTLLSGWPVAWAALRAVRLARLDMNALMTIAAAGALVTGPTTGQWLEAPTAMFLFAISLWLESYSLWRARRAVRTMVELTPTVAHRISRPHPGRADGEPTDAAPEAVADVPPEELELDDWVLVKPGERVPVDGVVVAGASTLNQAPITGESMPVERASGEVVYAGSLNGEGSLTLRVQRTSRDSTLAHIARLVEQARADRSPTARFVDRFAHRYTPAVIVLAILLACFPPLLAWLGIGWTEAMTGRELLQWLHRSLVLLVIACPCALVVSTPVTIVCGLHRATRYGILVKGGEFLENAGRIDCLAIDKTGTLTTGNPRVVRIEALEPVTQDEVLRIAAALESHSEHPLAGAIVAAAAQRNISFQGATDFQAMRGLGVEGKVDQKQYFVAGAKFFEQHHLGGGKIPPRLLSGRDAASVALVGSRDDLLGAIYLADEPRSDAAESIAQLKRLGIQRIVMLTGDNASAAQRVADAVGIEQFYAELLPDDKVRRVRQLAEQYPRLAMVGDGVNDAPALAASTLGIALGSQASDTVLETADVVVMSPHLRRLPQLVRLSRRTRRLLAQNIFLALTIKLLVLVLAALGYATMWMAVAADVGASMVVIFNGMRLLRGDDGEPESSIEAPEASPSSD